MLTRRRKKVPSFSGTPAAALSGIVEAGYLLAASDGVVTEEELQVLAELVADYFHKHATPEQIERAVRQAAEALTRDGFDRRLAAVREHLTVHEHRHHALQFAAAVMISDGASIEGEEDVAYLRLARALGFNERDAADALNEASRYFD